MLQKKLIIEGYLQGVGYRVIVTDRARRLKINGKVKNLSNGDIEIICQCDNVEQFQKFLDIILDFKMDKEFTPKVENYEVTDYVSKEKFETFFIEYNNETPRYASETLTKLDIGSLSMKSMHNDMINRFDVMDRKYDAIGKTLIKLEEHFGKLVEEFIGQKKKKL